METLITNVKIITPYNILKENSISIKKGKISKIIKDRDIDFIDYKKIINGQGLFLSPGFIDIHNHGNSAFDCMDASEEAIDKIAEYHMANGVTSFLGSIITSSYENMRQAIKNIVDYKNKYNKAQILGIHLEWPFLNSYNKGAQNEKYIIEPNIEIARDILDISEGKLKMISLAPELEASIELIRFFKKNNVGLAMAHSNASYNQAKLGIEEGVTIATHLYNGMKSFTHREPGIVGASLTDERVYCEIIYDRMHLHDAAVEIALKMKTYEKIILVSDSMRAGGLKDGEYELAGQRVYVKDGLPRLKSGNIAGSTLNLQKAIYNMINYLKTPIDQAVRMASLNPAKALKIDKDIGSIEVGKDADLLLFDENIHIKKVFIKGNLIIE